MICLRGNIRRVTRLDSYLQGPVCLKTMQTLLKAAADHWVVAQLNHCPQIGRSRRRSQGLVGWENGVGPVPVHPGKPMLRYYSLSFTTARSVRPSGNGPRIGTLSDIASSGSGRGPAPPDDDSDDEEGGRQQENWFTGGERRCVNS